MLYLIHKLREACVLNWNTEKPKPGIRQMVCIVFQILDFEYKEVEGKTDKVPVPYIHDIEINRRLLFGEESIDEGLTNLITSEIEEKIIQ